MEEGFIGRDIEGSVEWRGRGHGSEGSGDGLDGGEGTVGDQGVESLEEPGQGLSMEVCYRPGSCMDRWRFSRGWRERMAGARVRSSNFWMKTVPYRRCFFENLLESVV